MRTGSKLTLVALAGASGAAWGVSLWQWLHPPLPSAARAALARALGVDEAAVTVGDARLTWPARLDVRDVATGDWAAARVQVDVDPWAALGGTRRISRVRARELVSELGSVGEAEASWLHGHARVALRRVTALPADHWLGGLGLSIAEVGLETQGGALKRLAFAGATLGGVGELAGAATRAPDGAWLMRAARPGVTATARVDGDGVAGQATLEKLAVGELAATRGLSLGAATASGIITFSVEGGEARATVRVDVDDVTLDSPAVARRPVAGLGAHVDGELGWSGGAVIARELGVRVGKTRVVLDGSIAPGGDYDVTASLPKLACADLLSSLPHALVPHLDGLLVDGEIGGRVQVSGDTEDAAALQLDVSGVNGCRARADAPLGDAASLVHADAPTLARHTVDGRPLPLGPANPSWRALATLPTTVVRAFLVAEDGRFFVHHGFDVDRIGHALAADLDAGRFDRGASTITQQVAKNLWLGGERTFGRKIEEAVLAWRLEQVLDKRRILELYMNLVELGPAVYGIQDASEKYFGKLPDELSPDEAAQLAALLPAPRRGMDASWQKRYRSLAARMPSEHVIIPSPPPKDPPVKLSRR
ncbi:MAG: Monofunctional biosynthetic peptidoglycan transglycosylase [bacterium]|nr:Monofunctional biosynthetic peptidoglycan transglycosylase [bacterium]